MTEDCCNTTDGSEYCGFVCSDAVDKLQSILDEIKLLNRYNPEFAPVMLDRLTEMIIKTRDELGN